MKKERKPLTTREKVLIGVGVVTTCAVGYLGYKYLQNNVKTSLIEEELQKTKDELSFMKFLVVESGCTKMSLQNGENKLSRIRKKIAAEIENLALNPNDKQTKSSLMNHQKFEATLIDKIEKTIELDRLIDADENIYA